ncbi:His-Xaa-Ser system radical SAM maturase HxsB [Oleomonas cavernae]|uniref:His-Xaa-Ser system radical SAM maturase HxsB n=1 Tax=Oleomonas cavernae TaxID=2320859 RepID=UPI00131435FC|nr:His-Xaa-Ser system radical SAM maturase HxsB [Oleomonas cavernae]
MRFDVLPDASDRVILTSEAGDFLITDRDALGQLVDGRLDLENELAEALVARQMLFVGDAASQAVSAVRYRSRKSFIRGGPSLHLFVVTLRCDHSCPYCQVSRQADGADRRFDMTQETAAGAIDLLFSSPSPNLTVEFQGGEPLLNFDMIRWITEKIATRNLIEKREITFAITTTLHHADDGMLAFMREHKFEVSTSLDGPAELHNLNRPLKSGDSYARTTDGIERARAVLGPDKISALVTLTTESLKAPEAIIDSHLTLGFRSIFLRPLSPFGFAIKAKRRIGYQVDQFLEFYGRAIAYMIKLNGRGIEVSEAYASMLLAKIMTPYAQGYVDLRSPSGAGLGALVYNYDGFVYPSDEARMLAEMGDRSLALCRATDSYAALMASAPMQMLLLSGVAESLPGCSDCAYLPYCGADPIHELATQGDPVGHRAFSDHCRRHMGIFRLLFRYLASGDHEVLGILRRWATQYMGIEPGQAAPR